jgi:hypothetical protein
MIQAKMFFEDTLPTGGSKIPVGIHTGVMFMGLVKADGHCDINFQNASGQVIHKRLFVPDGGKPKEGESAADAIERQTGNNIKHVVHLLREIYGDEAVAQLEAPTYDKFIDKALVLLNPKKGFLVNLKVTPDRTGKYSDLGFFPTSYVEAFVEGKECQLRFTKKEQEALDLNAGKKEGEDLPY